MPGTSRPSRFDYGFPSGNHPKPIRGLKAPISTFLVFSAGDLAIMEAFKPRKPFEYHALGGQSFRIPSTGKYPIEKVKPSQGQPQLERTTKTFTHSTSSIPVSFYPLSNTNELKKMPEKIKNYFNPPSMVRAVQNVHKAEKKVLRG